MKASVDGAIGLLGYGPTAERNSTRVVQTVGEIEQNKEKEERKRCFFFFSTFFLRYEKLSFDFQRRVVVAFPRAGITYEGKIITVIRNESRRRASRGGGGGEAQRPLDEIQSAMFNSFHRSFPRVSPPLLKKEEKKKNRSSLRIRDAAGEHLISLFSPCGAARRGTTRRYSYLY